MERVHQDVIHYLTERTTVASIQAASNGFVRRLQQSDRKIILNLLPQDPFTNAPYLQKGVGLMGIVLYVDSVLKNRPVMRLEDFVPEVHWDELSELVTRLKVPLNEAPARLGLMDADAAESIQTMYQRLNITSPNTTERKIWTEMRPAIFKGSLLLYNVRVLAQERAERT